MPRSGFILYLLGLMLFSASPVFADGQKELKKVEKLVVRQLLKDSSSDEIKRTRYKGTNSAVDKCNLSKLHPANSGTAMLAEEKDCYKHVAIALAANIEQARQWCSFLGELNDESLSKWHLYPDAQVKVRKCFDQTAYYPY